MAKIEKKIVLVVCVLFLGVIFIEGGMRFAIWRSLRDVVPEKTSYTLLIENFEVLDIGIGCITKGDSNYLSFFILLGYYQASKLKLFADIRVSIYNLEFLQMNE